MNIRFHLYETLPPYLLLNLPPYLPPISLHQLHTLSALLLAPTGLSLRRLSAPGKAWISRVAARMDARVALQGLLCKGGRAIEPGRLETLVVQVQRRFGKRGGGEGGEWEGGGGLQAFPPLLPRVHKTS